MKQKLLRNAFTLKALLLVSMIVGAVSGAWAQESTLTEGFENATTSTSYQGTVTVTEKQSDCGIGWEIFYGTVSTSSKITGNNSAALRLYAGNDNYGYLKTTTPIEGLTNVAFKIKAATSNSASIKVIFSYSSDGTTWTDETAFTPATSSQDFTRPIPAGNKYVKFAISSTSTKPSKGNAQLTIDDVVFTYSNTDPSKEDAGLSFGETTIYNVSFGESFTAPTLINPNNLEVTYESGNNDVARVDENTGEITIVGGGEAIITASSAETDLYNAGRASYTLNVTDNRIATRISYGPIELDLADVATLTKLAPVVSDSEDNIIEYTYGEWPTEVSFEIVSDPDCMIGSLDNNSGDITLNAVEGTATIKAYYNYYNVNSTYKPSECTFTITVAAPFTGGDVTFAASTDKGNTTAGAGSITKNGVTFACSNGILGNGTEYRLYKDSQTTISTSAGKITKIVFTQSGTYAISNLTPDTGSLDELTWTGRASSVVFTAAAQARASQIVVTVDLKADPELSFPKKEYTAIFGEGFEAPEVSNPHGLPEITYASSDPGVASVDPTTGAVILVGQGTTIISASCPATEEYQAGSAEYTLIVDNNLEPTNIRFEKESVEVNVNESVEAPTLQYTSDAVPSYSSEDINIATVDPKSGLVTGVAEGTTTITAYLEETGSFKSGSASFTVKVIDPDKKGTENNPYTVAEAIAYISTLGTATSTDAVCVKGIISQIDSYNDKYNSITYWISDDGMTTNQMEVYSGKGLDGANFSAVTDLKIKDAVVVCGQVKMYNTTPEFIQNNKLLSLQHPLEAPTFSLSEGEYAPGQNVEITAGEGATIYYTIDGTSPTTASTRYSTPIDIQETTTIKAIAVKGEQVSEVASATYTIQTSPFITLSTNTITAPSEGLFGTITVTYSNISSIMAEVQFCDKDGSEASYDWFSAEINTETNNLDYFIEANEGEARTAYMKVFTLGDQAQEVYSEIITITQAKFVPDYASLPFEWDDTTTPTGITNSGVGTYTSSPYLKFDSAGDYIILKLNERPGTLTFDIKGNNFKDGTFKVQTSGDGNTYTDLKSYTELGDTQNESFDNLGENVRYIKWIYTNKSAGNVALGNIKLAQYVAAPPSITLAQYEYNVNADGGNATLPVTCTNMPEDPKLKVKFVEADGETAATYGWITAVINGEGNIAGHMDANTGEARTAYFVVTGVDRDENVVTSQLITIHQAAPAAPSITVEKGSIDFAASGESDRKLSFEYESLGSNPTFEICFFDREGNAATYEWVTTATIEDNKVNLSVAANDGEARTADFKVHAVGTDIYSNLITINQAAAPLPATTYSLAKTITPGKHYLVVGNNNGVYQAMGEQKSNNRAAVNVTLDGDKISITDEAVKEVVICGPDANGFYTIYESGYLYAASSGSNYLRSDGTKADANGLWQIDFNAATGEASVIASGSLNRNVMQYNATSGLFSCYVSASQKPVYFYERDDEETPVASYTRDVASVKWGTICLPNVATITGAQLYSIAGKDKDEDPSALYLTEVKGTAAAGTPYIFKPTASVINAYYTGDAATEAGSANGLIGSFTGTPVDPGKYLLSSGNIVLCGEGCSIAENRAYIDMSKVNRLSDGEVTGSEVKLNIGGGEDGISSLDAAAEGAVIYDLSGRRVSKTAKGLYIVNGKKVSVK